jgi:hypothetical protein
MQSFAKMIWPAVIESATETPDEQAPEPPPPPAQQAAPRRRVIDMTAVINRVLVAAGLRKET